MNTADETLVMPRTTTTSPFETAAVPTPAPLVVSPLVPPAKENMVLGFLFDKARQQVVLIRKMKPTWQAGLLNGIGGKVNRGESYEAAMAREFEEEAGVFIPPQNWRRFGSMKGPDWVVWLFAVADDEALAGVYSPTPEKCTVKMVHEAVNSSRIIPNLSWVIPMAREALTENFVVSVEYL